MAGIKKNFIYSTILTTANYIFPFLTYPYVSRVLGVTNIGLCNFVDSIINYFVLFSMMGISIVGIREIAKNKNDELSLNKTFSSLFALNATSTAILFIALIVSIYTVPKLYEHKELMWLGALKLASNFLTLDWLYRGLEDFKYITVRTIAVKLVYVACVFIFIHEQKDYPTYYLLLCLMVVGNALINAVHSRKFVHLSFKQVDIKTYIKPFFTMGMYMILTSMYTSFNVAFLGFSSGETEVGYYTTATKLHTILLALFTALTGVMLPRMSSLIGEQRYEEFKQLLQRSFNTLVVFAIPLVYFCMVMAPQIILIIAGKGYEGAITPMRIVMPLMLIIGYEQILIIQTLMPLKADKQILRNTILGASTGLLLNFILVPHLHSIGSSMVWFASELVVLCSAQYAVKKIMGISFPWKVIMTNIMYYLPLAILIAIVNSFIPTAIFSVIICGLLMVTYCYVFNVKITRNEEVLRAIGSINKKNKKLR